MVLKLYKIDDSPPCRAVMMLIQILKLDDVEYVDIDLFKGDQMHEDYLKINPQHSVPTLVDGDFIIWDSHAIIGYLISEYGKDDSLYPKEPKQRALIDQRLHFDTGILFNVLIDIVDPIFSGKDKLSREAVVAKINKAHDFLEKFLTKTWIAGDQFSVADLCCASTVSCIEAIVPIDVKKYPKVAAWIQRCYKLDYFTNTHQATKEFGDLVKSKLSY